MYISILAQLTTRSNGSYRSFDSTLAPACQTKLLLYGSIQRLCKPFLSLTYMTYIHIYTYTHIHIYTYIYIHTYTYIHIYMDTYIHIYIYKYNIRIYIYTYMHIYIYTYIRIYIYTYIRIYIYTYTHIHIYTYIHIYTNIHIYYIYTYYILPITYYIWRSIYDLWQHPCLPIAYHILHITYTMTPYTYPLHNKMCSYSSIEPCWSVLIPWLLIACFLHPSWLRKRFHAVPAIHHRGPLLPAAWQGYRSLRISGGRVISIVPSVGQGDPRFPRAFPIELEKSQWMTTCHHVPRHTRLITNRTLTCARHGPSSKDPDVQRSQTMQPWWTSNGKWMCIPK